MSKSKRRQRTARRPGRPRTGDRKPVDACPTVAPVSLPLPEAGQALPTPSPAKLPLSEDSSIRDTAIRIYVMRGAGVSDDQIAQTLGLSKKTLPGYIYKAGTMGWLDDYLHSAQDYLEHKLIHKVVKNLDEAMSDTYRNEKTGMQVKTAVSLKIAEGALFPRLQQQQGPNQTLMGIKIEVVNGAPQTIREGTIIEAPAYEEGQE
jgi:DNA-binding CsgD family transcriptional regulator